MRITLMLGVSALLIALIISTLSLRAYAQPEFPNGTAEEQTISSFTLEAWFAIAGDDDWQENNDSVNVKTGDVIEILMYFNNTGNIDQRNIVLSAVLPNELEYVSGSSILTTPSTMDGRPIIDGVATTGVNIGNYAPKAEAYLSFKAEFIEDLVGQLTITTSVDTASGGIDNTLTLTGIEKAIGYVVNVAIFGAFLAFWAICLCVDPARKFWNSIFDKSSEGEKDNRPKPKSVRKRFVILLDMIALSVGLSLVGAMLVVQLGFSLV